jgi:hypothetical protein
MRISWAFSANNKLLGVIRLAIPNEPLEDYLFMTNSRRMNRRAVGGDL